MTKLELYPGCPAFFKVTDSVEIAAQALAQSARTHERITDDMWNLHMAPDVREYHINARLEAIRADAEIFALVGHTEASFPTTKGA